MVIILDAQQTGTNADAHAQEILSHQTEDAVVLKLTNEIQMKKPMFMLRYGRIDENYF